MSVSSVKTNVSFAADIDFEDDRGRSLWADAVRRIKKNKLALVCFSIIGAYLLMALLCQLGLIFTNYNVANDALSYMGPSWDHWLGTDYLGRDVLARAAHGTITSLTVAGVGMSLSVLIGVSLGALAGYFGGVVDELVVWIYTTFDTIPYLLLVASFSIVMGPGLKTLCMAIGLTFWVGLCRLVRAEFIKHRNKDYVQGAAAVGASHFRRLFIHILPNVFHIILIRFSLDFVAVIKSEVIFSYLGLGVEPGTPSWGIMIDNAKLELTRGVWWGLFAATLFMFVLVLSFNLFNDALREALDPKLKNK